MTTTMNAWSDLLRLWLTCEYWTPTMMRSDHVEKRTTNGRCLHTGCGPRPSYDWTEISRQLRPDRRRVYEECTLCPYRLSAGISGNRLSTIIWLVCEQLDGDLCQRGWESCIRKIVGTLDRDEYLPPRLQWLLTDTKNERAVDMAVSLSKASKTQINRRADKVSFESAGKAQQTSRQTGLRSDISKYKDLPPRLQWEDKECLQYRVR